MADPAPVATPPSAMPVGSKPRPWYIWVGGAVAVLAVLYLGYAVFVHYSSGKDVTLNIEVGTYTDNGNHGGASMFLRCAEGSTPSVCSPGSDTFTVGKRDRVHVQVFNLDGGDHTHDIRLTGGAYWLWPAGFEDELNNCPSDSAHQPCATTDFTAWKTGTFRIVCEIAGHDDMGMHGTLVVS